MICLIAVWTVFYYVKCRTIYFYVRSIREICGAVATVGTVGYATIFTGSVKVVAHTVENKVESMLVARRPIVPHLSFEWTDTVHVLRCFWSSSRQSAIGVPSCLMSWLSGKDAGGSCSNSMVAGGWDNSSRSSWSLVTAVKVDKNIVTKLMNSYTLRTSGFCSRLLSVQYMGIHICIMRVIVFHMICRNMRVNKQACERVALYTWIRLYGKECKLVARKCVYVAW